MMMCTFSNTVVQSKTSLAIAAFVIDQDCRTMVSAANHFSNYLHRVADFYGSALDFCFQKSSLIAIVKQK